MRLQQTKYFLPVYFVMLLITAMLYTGCSNTLVQSQQTDAVRNKQYAKAFLHSLQTENWPLAARYAYYFDNHAHEQYELLAQFYLSYCSPRAASRVIAKIKNPNHQKLFYGILFGLTGFLRPKEKPQISQAHLQKKLPPITEANYEIYPLDKGEIWQDEWQDIYLINNACQQMPVADTDLKRRALQKLAKETLSELPSSLLMQEKSLIALALDTETELPGKDILLARNPQFMTSPYFQRLIEEETLQPSQVISQKTAGQTFDLSEISLEEKSYSPHDIQVPMVVNQDFLE